MEAIGLAVWMVGHFLWLGRQAGRLSDENLVCVCMCVCVCACICVCVCVDVHVHVCL